MEAAGEGQDEVGEVSVVARHQRMREVFDAWNRVEERRYDDDSAMERGDDMDANIPPFS